MRYGITLPYRFTFPHTDPFSFFRKWQILPALRGKICPEHAVARTREQVFLWR